MKVMMLALAAGSAAATKEVQLIANKPNSTVAPHYPYSSVMDFFMNEPLNKTTDLDLLGVTRCAANHPEQKVYSITDGKQERCFVTVTPTSAQKKPMPIVYFAHGSGGNAANCAFNKDLQGKSWTDIADEHGFAIVCGEALQYSATNQHTQAQLSGGLWEIPEVFTDTTGPKCSDEDSFDNTYMKNLIAKLDEESDTYDTSRFFVTGCSMGSAFTVWQGPCLHASHNVTAMATHSTGLKVKGDGLKFPPDSYNSQYTWGECPECKYWPTAVQKNEGLKACVFDNTADPNDNTPFFYESSEQLVKYWNAAGNRAAETHYGSGGHCLQHSFETIAECLDDGTGRLIPGGSSPSPSPGSSPSPSSCTDQAPDDKETCEQQAADGKCDKPWMEGFCCKTCFQCKTGCGK